MRYTRIARQKIAELIKRNDLLNILSISDNYVYLEFENDGCRVDGFGNVEWKSGNFETGEPAQKEVQP